MGGQAVSVYSLQTVTEQGGTRSGAASLGRDGDHVGVPVRLGGALGIALGAVEQDQVPGPTQQVQVQTLRKGVARSQRSGRIAVGWRVPQHGAQDAFAAGLALDSEVDPGAQAPIRIGGQVVIGQLHAVEVVQGRAWIGGRSHDRAHERVLDEHRGQQASHRV